MNKLKMVSAILAVSALAMTGCARADVAATGGRVSDGPVPTASCPESAFQAVPAGKKITLGVSLAQSGPIAVVDNVAKAMTAVFKKANADGGIAGHQIELIVRDDAFETARAVTNVRQLIDSDKVLATVGQVGTSMVSATQPFVEKSCTPQLWVGSGVSDLAANPEKHPFTTGVLPSYESESALWVKALQQGGLKGGRIVLINADDDRAKAYESGVLKAIKGTGFELAGTETVSAAAPSVDAQVNAALAKNPDAVLVGTNTTNCPPLITGLRRAGFKGAVLINNSCAAIKSNFIPAGAAANGVEVLTVTTDPSNPFQAGDPDLKEYRDVMAKYGADVDADSSYTAVGYQEAELTLAVLAKAAKLNGGLNRVNVMNAAWTIDAVVPLAPKGARATLNWTKDPSWRDQLQLMKYKQGAGLVPVGGVISVK